MPRSSEKKTLHKQPLPPLPPTSRRRPVPAPATDQPPLFRTMFKRASSAAWSVESRPRAPARRAPGARETPAVRRCTTRRSAVAVAHRRRRASGAEAPPLERRSRSRSAASGALGCGCLCESPTLSLTVCVLCRASGHSEPRFVSVGVWLHLSVVAVSISSVSKSSKEASRAWPSYSRPHHMGWRQHLRRLIKTQASPAGTLTTKADTLQPRYPEAGGGSVLSTVALHTPVYGARRRPRAQSGRERAARRPLRSSARLGACAPCRGRSGGQRGRGCCRSRT